MKNEELIEMSGQVITVNIEIFPDVLQQEVWDLEEQLRCIEGVTTDLKEPKDTLATIQLIVHIATSVMGSVAVVGGGIKAIYDVAKIIYDFLHPANQAPSQESNKHKVILRTKTGKKIELYDLSIEEIEKVLKEQ